MERTVALTWSWLNILTKKRVDALLTLRSDLSEALQALDEELLRALGCREETVFKTLNRLEEFDPAWYEKELAKRKIAFLSFDDEGFPASIKEIGDPPVFLYSRGDLSVLSEPCIALVGTREMSPYGKRVAELFTPAFVQAGMVTVSGLATGIDAVVAAETMRAGGRTVAVLGHGLGSIYPQSNARLAEEIVEHGGLLLSEFPLDAQPDKYTFPARNRIIAGLSLGTVVLEAPVGSGALITAELALDYGRDVFAVPGQIFDPNFAGSHLLLASGQAKLVQKPEDVLIEIGIVGPDAGAVSAFTPSTPDEAALYKILTTMPQSLDDLVQRSGLAAGLIGATLTILELQGAVKGVGEGKWVRR
ncbi:MAG: DNA-processing protein DprA [Candidatus Peregrinibacteria bacterium]